MELLSWYIRVHVFGASPSYLRNVHDSSVYTKLSSRLLVQHKARHKGIIPITIPYHPSSHACTCSMSWLFIRFHCFRDEHYCGINGHERDKTWNVHPTKLKISPKTKIFGHFAQSHYALSQAVRSNTTRFCIMHSDQWKWWNRPRTWNQQ